MFNLSATMNCGLEVFLLVFLYLNLNFDGAASNTYQHCYKNTTESTIKNETSKTQCIGITKFDFINLTTGSPNCSDNSTVTYPNTTNPHQCRLNRNVIDLVFRSISCQQVATIRVSLIRCDSPFDVFKFDYNWVPLQDRDDAHSIFNMTTFCASNLNNMTLISISNNDYASQHADDAISAGKMNCLCQLTLTRAAKLILHTYDNRLTKDQNMTLLYENGTHLKSWRNESNLLFVVNTDEIIVAPQTLYLHWENEAVTPGGHFWISIEALNSTMRFVCGSNVTTASSGITTDSATTPSTSSNASGPTQTMKTDSWTTGSTANSNDNKSSGSNVTIPLTQAFGTITASSEITTDSVTTPSRSSNASGPTQTMKTDSWATGNTANSNDNKSSGSNVTILLTQSLGTITASSEITTDSVTTPSRSSNASGPTQTMKTDSWATGNTANSNGYKSSESETSHAPSFTRTSNTLTSDSTVMSSSSFTASSSQTSTIADFESNGSTGMIIGIVVGVLILLIIIIVCVCVRWCIRKKNRTQPEDEKTPAGEVNDNPRKSGMFPPIATEHLPNPVNLKFSNANRIEHTVDEFHQEHSQDCTNTDKCIKPDTDGTNPDQSNPEKMKKKKKKKKKRRRKQATIESLLGEDEQNIITPVYD